jgi:hypothetical protein
MNDDHGVVHSPFSQTCYTGPYHPYAIDHYHTLSGEILMVIVIGAPLSV